MTIFTSEINVKNYAFVYGDTVQVNHPFWGCYTGRVISCAIFHSDQEPQYYVKDLDDNREDEYFKPEFLTKRNNNV